LWRNIYPESFKAIIIPTWDFLDIDNRNVQSEIFKSDFDSFDMNTIILETDSLNISGEEFFNFFREMILYGWKESILAKSGVNEPAGDYKGASTLNLHRRLIDGMMKPDWGMLSNQVPDLFYPIKRYDPLWRRCPAWI